MALFNFSRRDRTFGELFKPHGKVPVKGLYRKPELFNQPSDEEETLALEPTSDYTVSDVKAPYRENFGDRAIGMFRDLGLLSDLYNIATSLGNTRKERYREYDMMEESVLIASFLEMLADDAFQRDAEHEASVWVKDCDYREEIEKFLRDIDIENVGWGWMYTFIKYGDLFVKPEVVKGKGIKWLRDDLHPSDVWRIELNGKLIGFAVAETIYTGYSAPYTGGESSIGRIMDKDSMVHFLFNYRPLYERVKISIPKSMIKNPDVIQSLKENKVKSLLNEKEYDATGQLIGENEKAYTFSISAKYGSSALFNVRKDYKILNLEEQALALGRLARSAVARVFYVNTTGTNPKQRAEIMNYIETKFSKKRSFNTANDLFKSEYSPLNYLDDIFIPITGDVGDIKVEQIGGDLNIRDIVDIDFFLNKVFAGLRTPKSFLGFEECLAPQTLIHLVGGKAVTIKEIVDNKEIYIGKSVLTCSPSGKIEPSKIIRAEKTRLNAELVRVFLDNGKYVDTTPDHPFMMRDGSFVMAGSLKAGDSLMPLYHTVRKDGYKYIKNNINGEWRAEHRLVYESIHGRFEGKDFDIHHKDRDRFNNKISNLVKLNTKDHMAHHMIETRPWSKSSSSKRGSKKPWIRGDSNPMANPDIRERQKEGVRRSIENGRTWNNHVNSMSEEDQKTHMDKMRKARWAGKMQSKEYSFECPTCSTIFTRRYTDYQFARRAGTLKFCSRLCQRQHQSQENLKSLAKKTNHKVIAVEKLPYREDTYDIGVEHENHTFGLEAGIFVHNSLPGSLGNTTLVRLDIRYARMVKKLQRAFLEGLKELIRIHLTSKFGVVVDDDEIPLQMVAISGAEEMDRVNSLKEKIDAANSILSFIDSAKGDTRAVATVLYDRFLGLSLTDADGNILEGKDIFKETSPEEGEEGYTPPSYTPTIETGGGGEVPGEGQTAEAPELRTTSTERSTPASAVGGAGEGEGGFEETGAL